MSGSAGLWSYINGRLLFLGMVWSLASNTRIVLFSQGTIIILLLIFTPALLCPCKKSSNGLDQGALWGNEETGWSYYNLCCNYLFKSR